MLHEKIKTEMKQAMLAKETVRLGVIRGLLSAFTNELVSQKKKPDEMLDDESALAVIRREAKKRKDSISQFETGDRSDLAESEKEELKFIEIYLPQLMGRDKIKKLAEDRKAELAITNKSDAGKLMNALMKDLKGNADGGDVKAVVDEILL